MSSDPKTPAKPQKVKRKEPMTDQEMLKLAKAAGLTKSEMHDHPEHGLMISLSGVRKLAAMAPDAKGKPEFIAWLNQNFPKRP
jgi:hypothetical protein